MLVSAKALWQPVIFLGIMLMMAGCETMRPPVSPESLAFKAQHATLSLAKPIRISAKTNKVYFQKGRLVDRSKVNIVDPYCSLELKEPFQNATTVKSDHYTIFGVGLSREEISGGFARATAAVGEMMLYGTHLYLRSKKNKNIMRLNCIKMAAPRKNAFMTRKEFSKVTGSYAAVKK